MISVASPSGVTFHGGALRNRLYKRFRFVMFNTLKTPPTNGKSVRTIYKHTHTTAFTQTGHWLVSDNNNRKSTFKLHTDTHIRVYG